MIAAMKALAITQATPRPPRSRPSHRSLARMTSRAMPDCAMYWAMSTYIGIVRKT